MVIKITKKAKSEHTIETCVHEWKTMHKNTPNILA